MTNRVYITKSLTICGEDKHKTFIVGSHASVAEDAGGIGLGTDAVRCIGINADNVVISNLTITGGATKVPASGDNFDGNGGGIYAMNGRTGIYIVDCIISNNVAYRTGAMRYGNDNPGAKSQGMKQLMAGGGVALVGIALVPLLAGLFG